MVVEKYKVDDSHIAALINEGSQIKRARDKADERLTEIKGKLEGYNLPAGNHVTNDGNLVKIKRGRKMSSPDPSKTLKLMRKLGFGKFFVNVVSITIKQLEGYLNKAEIESLREDEGPVVSYTFE